MIPYPSPVDLMTWCFFKHIQVVADRLVIQAELLGQLVGIVGALVERHDNMGTVNATLGACYQPPQYLFHVWRSKNPE